MLYLCVIKLGKITDMGIHIKSCHILLGMFICVIGLNSPCKAQDFARSSDIKEIRSLKEQHLSTISRKEHSIEHMNAYALSLDKTNPITVAYLENYMQSAGEVDFSDEMFFVLQDYMEDVAKKQEVQHYIAAKKLKEVRQFLGFTLHEDSEGPILSVDFDYLAKLVKGKGSEALKSYVTQMQKELKKPVIKNGKLKISFKEVQKRLIFWDNFLLQHGDFCAKDRVVNHYNHYLQIFLLGTQNTPIFDNEKQMLLPTMEKLYQKTLKKYPNTHTYLAVESCYMWLLRNGITYSDELLTVVSDAMMKTDATL